MDIHQSPIGWVRSNQKGPREDNWGEVVSEISLDRQCFSPEAVDGLSEFSHVEVLFHLHGVDESSIIIGRRHLRGNPKWLEVVIFAQRAKTRGHLESAFVLHPLSDWTSLSGMGISRSLWALGVQPNSGLWRTRTAPWVRSMLRQAN